jgi:hypothetical protein
MPSARYRDLVAEGNALQDAGRHRLAEERYLEALGAVDPHDRTLLGMIYINLSNNARDDDRVDQAIEFGRQAIDTLSAEKGEAILQNAHVHFNIANWLLERNDPECLGLSAAARELYRAYPYTPAADLADSAVLYVVARIFLASSELSERDIHEAWQVASGAPADAMNHALLVNFLVNYLSFTRSAHPERLDTTMRDVLQWAGPDLSEETIAILERLHH